MVAVVAPDGSVTSPWTPDVASDASVAVMRPQIGPFRVVLLEPLDRSAELALSADGVARSLTIAPAAANTTLASTQVRSLW